MKKPELTIRQEKAIIEIIATGTIEGAAAKVGTSRGTIYNWLKEEPFKLRLEAERKIIFDEAVGLVKVATKQAAATLINLLDHRDPSVRRLSAKDILTFAIKAVELTDIEERLDRIEKTLLGRFRKV
jgi:hypothetical protein